jgi:hypothetical protein
MKPLYKGLLLAVVHVGLVCTLGAKLLYDRGHRPRVWIKAAIYDPDLPIRGKYLALSVEVPAEGFVGRLIPLGGTSIRPNEVDASDGSNEIFTPNRCNLVLRGNQLVAVANQDGEFWANVRHRDAAVVAVINGETAYFLPEHKSGPLLTDRNDKLWIEATIPRKGPPRPIRLGIKKDGVLTPLASE